MSHIDSNLVPRVVGGGLVIFLSFATGSMIFGLLDATVGPPQASTDITEVSDRFVEVLLKPHEDARPDLGLGAMAKREEGRVAKMDAGESGLLMGLTTGIGGLTGPKGAKGGGGGVATQAAEAPLRSWFPETVVWAPRVTTDAEGLAQVELTAPDQLSRWRVLGLSAARDGSLAGQVVAFETALDAFVDPAVPDFLRQGDRVDLPLLVGNRGAETLTAALVVEAQGLAGAHRTTVVVPPQASRSRTMRVGAGTPGLAHISASLGGQDQVVRDVEIRPEGRGEDVVIQGVIDGPRVIPLSLPEGASYMEGTLTVLAGPSNLVRGELGRTPAPGLSAAVGALSLGLRGEGLLAALGSPADPGELTALRHLRLRAQPQLLSDLDRAPLPVRAAALPALRAAGDDPLLSPLATHIALGLRAAQLPDGSWTVPHRSTVSQLVGTTAWIALMLDDVEATVRAGAVFERHLPTLLQSKRPDPHTLALVLATGTLTGDSERALRARVRSDLAALAQTPALAEGSLRFDGAVLEPVDLVLALGLAGLDPDAVMELVSLWTPSTGLGDGLRLAGGLELLGRAGPLDSGGASVTVTLDGQTHELVVHPGASVAALRFRLPLGAAAPVLELDSDAPHHPLSFTLEQTVTVPWAPVIGPLGLRLESTTPSLQVGELSTLELALEGPDAAGLELALHLPAGVEVVPSTLEGASLLSQGEGLLQVALPADRAPRHLVRVDVHPTLSGTVHTGAFVLSQGGDGRTEAVVLPQAWRVEGA